MSAEKIPSDERMALSSVRCTSEKTTLSARWVSVRRSQTRRSKGNRRPSQRMAGVNAALRLTPTSQEMSVLRQGMGECHK